MDTYPHTVISRECKKKFTSKWDILECVINSTQIFYGKIEKNEDMKCVIIPHISF